MFSRLKNFLSSQVLAALKLIIGDVWFAEARVPNDKGVTLNRLGPPKLGWHVAEIKPVGMSSQDIAAQLKTVMELPEPNARMAYMDINLITNSAFFLAMNTAEGERLRRRLMGYLSPKVFYAETVKRMPDLIDRIIFVTMIEKNQFIDIHHLISRHIMDLFSEVFLGFKLNNVIYQYVKKEAGMPYYFMFPTVMQNCLPPLRKARYEFDRMVESFLQTQILQLANENDGIKDNFFVDMIREHSAGKSLRDLTTRDIQRLVKHPEVRLCISGMMAVHNITRAIRAGIKFVLMEIAECKTEDSCRLFNGFRREIAMYQNDGVFAQMPLLHAIYLETLRLSAPMATIIRYAENGIATKTLTLPKKTFIKYELGHAMRYQSLMSDRYPATDFFPQRYLTPEDQIHPEVKSHQNMIVPAFGQGSRSCPAVHVSAVVFKTMLIGLTKHFVAVSNGLPLVVDLTLVGMLRCAELSRQKEQKQSAVVDVSQGFFGKRKSVTPRVQSGAARLTR
jgi:cytochrome P450